jgi:polyisoprenoid-binding protein YceI
VKAEVAHADVARQRRARRQNEQQEDPKMTRLIAALLLALLPAAVAADTWRLDPETEIVVEVPWFGGRAIMRFPTYAGTVTFDERDLDRASARIVVSSRDVTTGFGPADTLARSSGFLAAAEHPEIAFALDRIEQTSRSTADVFGAITFRGVTRPIRFAATVFRYGPAAAFPGRFEAGFDIEGSIDRTEFGSTQDVPAVAAILPVRIHLLMVRD